MRLLLLPTLWVLLLPAVHGQRQGSRIEEFRMSGGFAFGIFDDPSDDYHQFSLYFSVSASGEYLRSFTSSDTFYWGVGLDTGFPLYLLPTFNLHYKGNFLGLLNRNYAYWDWSIGGGPIYIYLLQNGGVNNYGWATRGGGTFNVRIIDGVFIELSVLAVFPLATQANLVHGTFDGQFFRFPIGVRWRL